MALAPSGAMLVFVALNHTTPPALQKPDVDAVAVALGTAARGFEECMAPCFSKVCTAYSPHTGECTRRRVGPHCSATGFIGHCHLDDGCCINATHARSPGTADAPDLREWPGESNVLVPLSAYTFSGTHVGIDVAAMMASLDSGVAAELAMLRSLFGTYDNATWFLVNTGYVMEMGNPTILPRRYPTADQRAKLLARMPPWMFEPNATLLHATLPAPAPLTVAKSKGKEKKHKQTSYGDDEYYE